MTKRTSFRYSRIGEYEAAYDVTTRYGAPVGEVERQDESSWVAELTDGRRGFGSTRDAAIRDAQSTAQQG